MLRAKFTFIGCVILCACTSFLSACNTEKNQADTKKKEEISTLAKNSEVIAEKPSYKTFFTTYFEGSQSNKQTSFNCDDQVFAVIEFNNYPAKLHQVEVEWRDPFGQVREQNDFQYFITGVQAFAWASLKLHRGTGAGLLQWVNPAAGMEEFIGEWTVDVRVGDIIQETVKFEVLC